MRDKECPPKKGVKLEVEDDDDSDDAPRGGETRANWMETRRRKQE